MKVTIDNLKKELQRLVKSNVDNLHQMKKLDLDLQIVLIEPLILCRVERFERRNETLII